MNSRPGPGIQDQQRGSGGPPGVQLLRRPSRPSNAPHVQPQDCIDPSLESLQRSAEETLIKARGRLNTKVQPEPLEGIQTPASEPLRPLPRGKPQLSFSSLANHVFDTPTQSPRAISAHTGTALPAPPRPGSSAPAGGSQMRRVIPGGTGVKGDAATKPPSVEAPAPAIVFPGESRFDLLWAPGSADEPAETVDFFPWSGNHPEDIMSEALVKGGISNKAQVMNETNTARPSLWSNLKNKSGLSTLSTLFVAVLEKRQATGRLTAPSSFKPPPRLTLRDSTRETWLHDLANPAVGLRRLSRTIPHGITGKVLLEQCLNKNIPLPRALWLAKCVGINEMRAHKRKGQAGTITWVRGWTSCVEQFLDSLILTIGQQEWKPRVTYAIQLATHLYKEHLLEGDHFLDWLLKCLETCVPERLFIWLLLVSVHWTDLSTFRRRGKRLADALLAHVEKLRAPDDDERTSPLGEYLESTIIRLVGTSPLCFLNPKLWQKHCPILHDLVEKRSSQQLTRIILDLDRRNKRFIGRPERGLRDSNDSARLVLCKLDAVDYKNEVPVGELASECMELIADPTVLISTALQWASSIFRDGVHRIYLVTRLLRRWNHLGLDIYDGILSHLGSSASTTDSNIVNVFRIVAELVRSRTFSVSRYLQWLIATGAASQCQDLQDPSSWCLRLAVEIPLTGAPEATLNLRAMLLRTAKYSTEKEDRLLEDAEVALQKQLPGLFGVDPAPQHQPTFDTTALNSTLRLELGIWLRAQVDAFVEMVDRVPTKDPSIEESGLVCMISTHDFHIVRSYIEEFGDFSILADIIGIVAASLDGMVLASAADTLHYSYKAFSAIGAFKPLFEKIAMRYASLRTIRFPERELLTSLADLAQTAQANGQLMQMLAYDMSRYDLKNSLAACSPVSDVMTDSANNTSLDTDEEVDRILSSGTSMDQQVMSRVFSKIVVSVEQTYSKLLQPSEHHSTWFWRLRNFDESAFDRLVTRWLKSRLMSHQTQAIYAVLPPLISSSSFGLVHFLDIVQQCVSKRKATDPDGSVRMCVEALHIIMPPEQMDLRYISRDVYRYHLEQQRVCGDAEGPLLTLVRSVLNFDLTPPFQSQVSSLLSNAKLRQIVRQFALADPSMLATYFDSADESNLKALLDGLFDPANHLKLQKKSAEDQIVDIVQTTHLLSLPFSQLEIQHIFSSNPTTPENSGDTVSAALLESIKKALERDDIPWSELVAGLDTALKTKLCEHAEREILRASAVVGDAAVSKRPNEKDDAFLQKYLLVVDFTASAAQKDGQTQILAMLVERLRSIVEALGKASETAKQGADSEDVPTKVRNLCIWLGALLHLVVVHIPLLSHKLGHNPQAALLWCLRSLFVLSAVQLHPAIVDYTFDVAIILSDSLSDEARTRLIHLDSAKPLEDPRCAFIFGTSPQEDGWLCLTRPVPTTVPTQPNPSLQSTSQTGASQSPHQQFSNTPMQTPNPASMQRSLSQQHQTQVQNAIRGYQQYSQHSNSNKIPPQLQRMVSGSQTMQQSQLQQMQHMQQRSQQPSPVQMQRQTGPPAQSNQAVQKRGLPKLEKHDLKTMPFILRRWEILPENSGNPLANDTALSLSLFGARKL
ncbi:hypothetical protein BDV96DRAFT_607939 [Lophiotrema nucula]|uniref:Mediator of RNA polymerase II transcription subunit 12 n=1 Tax=Lophiotrema nucula TaxID=690887 RepID=A0A6A5YGJ8_9PLEO|nr:hypothetical protein BDV96DRAFT_607939 [Lophiotrema nucula]